MPRHWILVAAAVAAAHFAATAGTQVLVVSKCRGAPAAGCAFYEASAGVLSLPLLPVVLEFSSGTIGWRRAFAIFAANSLLVSAVLIGAIGFVTRSAGGRGPSG